jgi:hypothetical protein
MEPQVNGASATRTGGKRKKPNSPKAPGTSLRTAITETSKLYQRYSHGTFGRGEMAHALAMSNGSGAFLAKAAALKGYGLIEDTANGSIRVTDLFKALYSAPAGSPELKRNALRAVSLPPVYAGLLAQFKSKIPDEDAIALRLETTGGFNHDRAAEVAGAFRGTLLDFGLIDESGNVLPVRDDDHVEEGEQRREAETVPDVPAGPGIFRVEVPLGPGRRALLALPEDIGAADTAKICAVLAAYGPTA